MRSFFVLSLVLLMACGRVNFRTVEDSGIDAGTELDAALDGNVTRDTGVISAIDACVPSTEDCDGRDDDCDGIVDEDFDLDSDVSHCGECGSMCSSQGGTPTCAAGDCEIACDVGVADCDGDISNGCETDLARPETCGDCTTACAAATPLCQDGACVDACMPGTTLCDLSCVDLNTNPLNCGDCDMDCSVPNAVPGCSAGVCNFECEAVWDDCDMISDNGCEARLDTIADCGSCGTVCEFPNAIAQCADTGCIIASCAEGFLDCNGDPSDGCEATGTAFWPDEDDDGFGDDTAPATRICGSIIPLGTRLNNNDCDDGDADVRPTQTGWFTTPSLGTGTFDYDCDGVPRRRWNRTMMCISGPMCLLVEVGWRVATPLCGVAADYVTDCSGAEPCTLDRETRTQECH